MSAAKVLEAEESPFELKVAAPPLEFDGRRPWPLGVPSKEDALAAILSKVEVEPALEGSQLRVLTLLPEWIFDEARAGTEVAFAAASTWRAVVALERADNLLGVDTPALLALIDETVQAREKLVGASAFALDAGAGSEELISTVDECIGRFVVLARHHERAPSAPVPDATKLLSVSAAPRSEPRKKLPWVFAASMVLTVLFHVGRLVMAPTSDVWLVNGSLESGNAILVPGGPGASSAALEQKIAELRGGHVRVVQSHGQWMLSKEP